VILDIFSRYVVGWMIAPRESAQLAEQLIAETVAKQNVAPGVLTLHADRGTSMRSKTVTELLVDLEVTKSHSRPSGTTTPSPRRSSRPSSTVPTSRSALAASKTRAPIVSSSSLGTTTAIAIPASAT